MIAKTPSRNPLYLLIITAILLPLFACSQAGPFVTVRGHHFELNGKPYYYIGTNYWYGNILASKTSFGNRERLIRELDEMKDAGINNLRVYVGAEGPDNEPFRVTPALQLAPGKYNPDMLDGLDFLMSEMSKRGMKAIIYLNNSWDWSGGYAQYASWNGLGPIPYPMVKPHTWPEFMSFAGQFHNCEPCKKQFRDHVHFILGRTNAYTGLRYTEDPAIMAWEIGNEPRAFSQANIPVFVQWLSDVAADIRSLDPNHLITTGTEGQHGCEESLQVFEQIHANPNISYLTVHIWPKNWSWLNIGDIPGSLDTSIKNTNLYLNDHMVIAARLDKPLVLEEFGLPRDKHGYSPSEPVSCRDAYYRNAFDQVLMNASNNGVLAGCNFWGFGGEGIPAHLYWQPGDDYVGDPPNEEQGLNSVFLHDSTMDLVRTYNHQLKSILK